MTGTDLSEIHPDEIAALVLDQGPQPKPARPRVEMARTPAVLRHTHHQIARLLALGTRVHEVALITGYSPGHISSLQSDPAFKELIAYYSGQVNEVFIDAARRLKDLGLLAQEELIERLSTNPKDWTKKELREILELCFGKGAGLDVGTAKGAPSPVAIEVTFVNSSVNQSSVPSNPQTRIADQDHPALGPTSTTDGDRVIEGSARIVERPADGG